MWSLVASLASKDGSPPPPVQENHQAHARVSGGGRTSGNDDEFEEWQLVLDSSNRLNLRWRVKYAQNEIRFRLIVNNTANSADASQEQFRFGSDVFALGFSERGELFSSDFCMIWFDLSQQMHMQDAHSNEHNTLSLVDPERSACRLQSSDASRFDRRKHRKRRHKTFEVSFTRPLDVCNADKDDDEEYYHIDNGTTHLVWFKLRGPLLQLDGVNLTQLLSAPGAQSGMRRAQLIAAPKPAAAAADEQTSSHDVLMDGFEVPAQETTYWCKLFKLPHKFESRKYHITRYEALIAPRDNERVVHHMELFNCANLSPQQERDLNALYTGSGGGWSGECAGADRPQATQPCRRVVLAWAMGARPLEYPAHAGQPVGGAGYSTYMVLEVHYNNPMRLAGLIDSSGLRFEYTHALREHDAGILEVGLEYTDKNSVPPGVLVPLAGHCVSECTRVAMSAATTTCNTHNERSSDAGIYVFAGQLHTHLTGVASWTEQVRAGALVRELQRDDHYSPHFQEIRSYPQPVHVAPGDALVHYCLYDTRARSNITLGGFGTQDEMCVTYLHYYPRIDLEVCKSSVDSAALSEYFAYLAREESQPINNGSVANNYRAIEWSKRRARELLELYDRAPLDAQCNRSDGSRWPGHWTGMAPTRLWPHLHMSERPYTETAAAGASGAELAAYRGAGFAQRHAQCASAH